MKKQPAFVKQYNKIARFFDKLNLRISHTYDPHTDEHNVIAPDIGFSLEQDREWNQQQIAKEINTRSRSRFAHEIQDISTWEYNVACDEATFTF